MISRLSLVFLLISICLQVTALPSAVKADIKLIGDLYSNDDSDNARIALQKAIPITDEERAVVLYYKAMLSPDCNLAKGFLQQLCDTYPKSAITQKGYLELGHILLLDRDYTNALNMYRQITDPSMPEKHYWIANTQSEMGNYSDAIATAEVFLRSSNATGLTEDAYFLIADSYINLEQYNNAVSTLNKLQANQKELDDEQYFHYRCGYANEMLGSRSEALSHYRQGYEINRFSQMAYLIEDRLFNLKDKYGAVVDLSFLYPYSEAPLPEIVLNNPVTNTNNTDVNNPVVLPTVPAIESKQVDKAPEKGIFLQAGRFSNKSNAAKLSDKIAVVGFPCLYYQSTSYQDVSWVVICGPFETSQLATDARDNLKTNNIDSFVIQR